MRPQAVGNLSRRELEDECYRLSEENLGLKHQINSQDDKIKRLSAKLVKAIGGKGDWGPSDDALQDKVRELEKQNLLIKNKLRAAKHQLAYFAKTPLAPAPHRHSGGTRTRTIHSVVSTTGPPSVSDQLRGDEKRMFEQTIQSLQDQLDSYVKEVGAQREELRQKEVELEKQGWKNKQQLSLDQRSSIKENVELIRLQRQLREKSVEEAQIEARCAKLQVDLSTLKETHQEALVDLERLNQELSGEKERNSELHAQISSIRHTEGAAESRWSQEVDSLRRENASLKRAQEDILTETFNTNRQTEWLRTERALKEKVAELEHIIRADVHTKNDILEKFAAEIQEKERAEGALRAREVEEVKMKAELERLEGRLEGLGRGGKGRGVDWGELEKALALYRQMEDTNHLESSSFRPHSPTQGGREELDRLSLELTETVSELEKTRTMLLVQHRINRDYQREVEALGKQSEEYKFQFERRLQELTDLFNQRTQRIQRLETNLRNSAYGRFPSKSIPAPDTPPGTILDLEPGQNLLEVHVRKFALSSEGGKLMGDLEPAVFLTLEFFDFEIQFTPVFKGPNCELDFTAQYKVTVTDLLIHYFQTESLVLELHQALGTSYKTWAAASVRLDSLLFQEGRILGTAELRGVVPEVAGTFLGKVDFSISLRVSLERSMAFFKKRAMALGYIVSEEESRPQVRDTVQLIVDVHRCNGLRNQTGSTPSAYTVYQLFDFPVHDTRVLPEQSNPEFADNRVWTLPRGRDLEDYLRLESVRFMVFDDRVLKEGEAFLGAASVPLLPLLHNKPVSGTFQLFNEDQIGAGTIDVSVAWKTSFAPTHRDLIMPELRELRTEELEVVPTEPEGQKELQVTRTLPEPIPPKQPPPVPSQRVVAVEPEMRKPESPKPEPRPRLGSYTIEPAQAPVESQDPQEAEVEGEPKVEKEGETRPKVTELPDRDFGDDEEESEEDDDVILPTPAPRRASKDVIEEKDEESSKVVLELKRIFAVDGSPLLEEAAAFFEWELMDLPERDCETLSFPLPDHPDTPSDVQFLSSIPMNPTRIKLLEQMLVGEKKVIFTLVSDPGPQGDCEEMGSATLDLTGKTADLVDAYVNIKSPDGLIGRLQYSFRFMEAMTEPSLTRPE